MGLERKLPLARALQALIRDGADDQIAQLGLGIPGRVVAVTGAIVTVNFSSMVTSSADGVVTSPAIPNVTMPLAGPEYIRYPIQVGDKGVALPASFFLGGVSGLTNRGDADTAIPDGNLATLFWLPLGNALWTPSPDPNALVMYGPDGVILQSGPGPSPAFTVKVNSTGVTILAGATVIFEATASAVTIQESAYLTHEHLPGTLTAPSGGGPVTGDTGVVT